jgi:DNA end-binding protein Ku
LIQPVVPQRTPNKYKRWCPVDEKEIAYSEIKKGYEIQKDNYLVLERNGLEKTKLNTAEY